MPLWLQPLVGSQASVVQVLLSLQSAGVPVQVLAVQASLSVQALPSSHAPLLAEFRHFCPGVSQLSAVHTLPSSQLVGFTPLHSAPSSHASALVQKLPSLQAAPTTRAVPLQVPATQPSLPVQALPSLQGAPLLRLLTVQVPLVLSQPSSVHGLPSSHTVALPGLQLPLAQASPVVQASPSLQGRVLGVELQPPEQASVVHSLPSSQALLPRQMPVLQASPLVQVLLSLQGVPLLAAAKVQPLTASQLSTVQALLSAQTTWVPTQLPDLQASPLVHTVPSLHELPSVLALCRQPCLLSQASLVQPLLSSQLPTAPEVQMPLLQASPVVQALSSLQLVPLATGL
jgi:hypothetical protein